MGVIGNVIGSERYIDVPITAGTDPTVTWTTDRALDLLGVEVLAQGATSAALQVDGNTVAAGAIAEFDKGYGSVHAATPSGSVPTASTGGAAQQNNSTTAGYVNWQSSGTVQGGGSRQVSTLSTALTTDAPITALPVAALTHALVSGASVTVKSGTNSQTFTLTAAAAAGATSLAVTSATPNFTYPVGSSVVSYISPSLVDRNGSVPNPGAVTPLKSAIASGKDVVVSLTGDVVALFDLPEPDANGLITMPGGSAQSTTLGETSFTDQTVDSVPFQVKASDTLLDTFAGFVRLIVSVPVSDPNAAGKAAGTYPDNGIQKGSAGIY